MTVAPWFIPSGAVPGLPRMKAQARPFPFCSRQEVILLMLLGHICREGLGIELLVGVSLRKLRASMNGVPFSVQSGNAVVLYEFGLLLLELAVVEAGASI